MGDERVGAPGWRMNVRNLHAWLLTESTEQSRDLNGDAVRLLRPDGRPVRVTPHRRAK